MEPPAPPAIGPAYSVARAVALSVHAHFARHLDAARESGDETDVPLPDSPAVEAIIDVAFWASLRREEGYIPKISLALLPPRVALRPLLFERPLPLTAAALTRLAPAVERRGTHLGVWPVDGRLVVWGTTRVVPRLCLVLEVAGPGLLVVKQRRGEDAGKFLNITVLEGDEVKVVDERASSLPDCPALLTSLLGFDAPDSWADPMNVLVQLAVSMRAHGRGGSLLVVPSGSEAWRESIVRPIPYAVAPPFAELGDLMRADAPGRGQHHWVETLGRSVDAIAGLTAVDGATLLTDHYELLAFGAKIGRRDGWPQVERVVVTEPIEGSTALVTHPTQLGNTRHLSAAQFVQDQRDAVALVASQDGRFTIFAWSPCEDMVHAHRVETLLL